MAFNKTFNKLGRLFANKRDSQGRTALYRAAKDGNINRVRELLKDSKANPNICTKKGLSPLHQAAHWGEVEIVKLLLDFGADPNCDNGKGWTPLHSAALAAGLKGRKEVIKLLLEAGADPNKDDANGWTPVHYAALWKNNDTELGRLKKKILPRIPYRHFASDEHQPDIRDLGLKKPDTTGVDEKFKVKKKPGGPNGDNNPPKNGGGNRPVVPHH